MYEGSDVSVFLCIVLYRHSLYFKIATTPLPVYNYVMHAVYCKFTLYFDYKS